MARWATYPPARGERVHAVQANYFNSLERPLIFVPGDNDWTDCRGRYGPATLPYSDPEERLDFERNLFFSTDRSLGQHTLRITRQTAEGYPENQRWKLGPVVYLGLNVQGSNDNYAYHDTETGTGVPVRSDAEIQRQRNEEIARKAADFRWLEEGFEDATRVGAKGVMIIWIRQMLFVIEIRIGLPGTLVSALRRSIVQNPRASLPAMRVARHRPCSF
jgi:hypothetical protein